MVDEVEVNNAGNIKWICPHCKKHYSKNYKYKKHLEKCIVYQSTLEQQYDVLLEIKMELKQQFSDMFKDMISELKRDVLNSNQPCSAPIVKKKSLAICSVNIFWVYHDFHLDCCNPFFL